MRDLFYDVSPHLLLLSFLVQNKNMGSIIYVHYESSTPYFFWLLICKEVLFTARKRKENISIVDEVGDVKKNPEIPMS